MKGRMTRTPVAVILGVLAVCVAVVATLVVSDHAVSAQTTTPAPAATVAAQTPATQGGSSAVTTVSVAGEGVVIATPDIARISAGVQVRDTTVAAVQSKAATTSSAIIAAAKTKGVADADIQTTDYSVQATYDYSQNKTPTFTGYVLTNTLEITVRGIDKDKTLAGGVIDAVAGAGANIINGITFDVSDTTSLRNQAISAAIADAQAKATQIAAAGKFSIGGINAVTETGAARPQPVVYAGAGVAASAPAATPVENGAFRYTYTVQVAFTVK